MSGIRHYNGRHLLATRVASLSLSIRFIMYTRVCLLFIIIFDRIVCATRDGDRPCIIIVVVIVISIFFFFFLATGLQQWARRKKKSFYRRDHHHHHHRDHSALSKIHPEETYNNIYGCFTIEHTCSRYQTTCILRPKPKYGTIDHNNKCCCTQFFHFEIKYLYVNLPDSPNLVLLHGIFNVLSP